VSLLEVEQNYMIL